MESRPNSNSIDLGRPNLPGAPAPISRVRASRGLREQIAEQLRLEIIRGNHPPGEPLIERKLAARFKVSHAPVREALLQMAHEGLAVAVANYGVRVAEPAPWPLIENLISVRQGLIGMALQAATLQMTDEHFLWLESCTTLMSSGIAQRDAGAVREGDFLFHRAILEWSEMPQLYSVCRAISGHIQLHFATRPMDFERAQTWVEQHLAVVTHLRQRRPEAALEMMLANIADEMQS